ncbi:hypothetical protein, partial [Sphingomonas trueperi]|uniref:hypothetical protein n=1 Tax=Sphingomonas trueperi TaxID=53317 RepID=UPI0031D8C609
MSWKPAPHPLRWPLTVDDTTLAELPLRPILHGEHAELMRRLDSLKSERPAEGKPLEDIEFDELAFLSLASMTTGLKEGDVKRLKRPDFNGLASRVLE